MKVIKLNGILLFLIILTLGMQGCAKLPFKSSNRVSVRYAKTPRDYTIQTAPVDREKSFVVILTSRSDKALCLSLDDWPNIWGQVSGGAGRAILTSNNRVLPAADTDLGECFGKTCFLQILPHHIMYGLIRYKEFGDPDEIAALDDKHLAYFIRPYFCSVEEL